MSSPSPRCRASGRLSFLPCPSHQPTWFGPDVLALGNMPFCRCLIESSATVWAEYEAWVGGRCYGGSSKCCDRSLQHSSTASHTYRFIHVIIHSFDQNRKRPSLSSGLSAYTCLVFEEKCPCLSANIKGSPDKNKKSSLRLLTQG